MTTILLIGTFDTKSAELDYLAERLRAQDARPLTMDAGVLGDAKIPVDMDKHSVARAAGKSVAEVAASGDENSAMEWMAKGAAALARRLHSEGEIHGMLALGGSMGTDLALDVARALPTGVPKCVVSTIAFSPLIPAERLPPDLQMILWAGGLYGLNEICRASLSQAAGAVAGACRAVQAPRREKPMVGITSLGASCLRYMMPLKPALEERGFEAAVFHATGMGGRAFESLAAEGAFAAVMDFCTQEVGNHLHGSPVSAGADRMENAGRRGVPQIIAPGCMDLVDLPAWAPTPEKFAGRPWHAHNRLLGSAVLSESDRRKSARALGAKIALARAPVHVILPLRGVEEWDKPGAPACDPDGLAAFMDEMKKSVRPPAELTLLDAHINDAAFAETALEIFDAWRKSGVVANQPENRHG